MSDRDSVPTGTERQPMTPMPRPCATEGCDRKPNGAGRYCRIHAKRNHHYGHPDRIMLCEVVAGPLDTPCLVVRKPTTSPPSNRYPRIQIDGRKWRAHRFIWTAHHGPIPDGLQVRHRCDNPPCVRIDHLVIGTHEENMADMARRGRKALGEKVNRSRITDDDVRVIRARHAAGGVTYRELAAEYGVHPVTILRIVKRESRRHVR